MTTQLTVIENGKAVTIPAETGMTILAALQHAGMRQVDAPCGGNGRCGKCLISVTGAVAPPAPGEVKLLAGQEGRRLACLTKIEGACTVTLSAMDIAVQKDGGHVPFSFDGQAAPGLGAAVDIGTTTVVLYLYDLVTGQRLDVRSGTNRQRTYGADVISRIQYGMENADGLSTLAGAIRGQLSDFLTEACRTAGRDVSQVRFFTIAGNTVMEHIFSALSPASIAVAPFTPLSLFGHSMVAADCGLPGATDATVFLSPCVAGYVGGDITAGLLSSGAYLSEKPVLFLDIGTNGEMALGNRDGFRCCATAAGPAFEGAEIFCGMSGTTGAIDHVQFEQGRFHYTVIGGGLPQGLCGSGLVDVLAALLQIGAVDETGRMLPPDEAPDCVLPFLEEAEDGVRCWLDLDRTVCLTAGDVRKLQLAKAAIAAGILTLLETASLTADDVDTLYLAGGFGSYINQKSAGEIGLFPPGFVSKVNAIGNSAGMGAIAALLSRSSRDCLTDICSKCQYVELSGLAAFNDNYIECMAFE